MANPFSKVKNAFRLLKQIDFDQLNKLSEKVDLPKALAGFSNLDDNQLSALMKMLQSEGKAPKELPEINGDFYEIHLRLTEEQRAIQLKVRNFMETEIKPLVNEYWLKDEFPIEILPKF